MASHTDATRAQSSARPIVAACLLTLALTPANRLYLLLPVWLFCTLTILGLESVFTTNGRERRW
ncbi:MAG: hypothetical protein LBV44_10045 [Methylobacillus sp.]|jgi:hypothetical protein|nr:hypothetical protein [Methylobacillus sp.]